MAGSYHHVLNGWSLIENMGDAAEAVEEPMWLVESQIGAKKAIDNDCIDFTIGNDKSYVVTVKHTLWWKIGIILSFIGIILSYIILLGMALWMIFQE